MCIAPVTMWVGPKGDKRAVLVACHDCWQCRENRINDWVGRNIAESKTARSSHAVTLTYGRGLNGDADHPRAVVLTYSDVQKFFKLLRRHGFPVRYFVTGEFGSFKGRAHWHVMLYWQGDVPPHEIDTRFMEKHWPHGFSFWTKPTHAAIRYNCKYILKDVGEMERQGHLAMSKEPPLGAVYFDGLAKLHAEQGLAPQTLEYTFPEVDKFLKDGTREIVRFRLRDRSADLFLLAFLRHWETLHPGVAPPSSKVLDEFLDPGAWAQVLGSANGPIRAPLRPWKAKDFDNGETIYSASAAGGISPEPDASKLGKLPSQEERLSRVYAARLAARDGYAFGSQSAKKRKLGL